MLESCLGNSEQGMGLLGPLGSATDKSNIKQCFKLQSHHNATAYCHKASFTYKHLAKNLFQLGNFNFFIPQSERTLDSFSDSHQMTATSTILQNTAIRSTF